MSMAHKLKDGNAPLKPAVTTLVVGGTAFVVTDGEILDFGSEFLSTLTDFRDKEGIYYIDRADPECFSAFLHMSIYGSLPVSMVKSKEDLLVEQSKFWCIEEKVQEILKMEREEVCNAAELAEAKKTIIYMKIEMGNYKCNHKKKVARAYHRWDGRRYCSCCGVHFNAWWRPIYHIKRVLDIPHCKWCKDVARGRSDYDCDGCYRCRKCQTSNY